MLHITYLVRTCSGGIQFSKFQDVFFPLYAFFYPPLFFSFLFLPCLALPTTSFQGYLFSSHLPLPLPPINLKPQTIYNYIYIYHTYLELQFID